MNYPKEYGGSPAAQGKVAFQDHHSGMAGVRLGDAPIQAAPSGPSGMVYEILMRADSQVDHLRVLHDRLQAIADTQLGSTPQEAADNKAPPCPAGMLDLVQTRQWLAQTWLDKISEQIDRLNRI